MCCNLKVTKVLKYDGIMEVQCKQCEGIQVD